MAESDVVHSFIVVGRQQLNALRIVLFTNVQHSVWKASTDIKSTGTMSCQTVVDSAFNKFSAILQSGAARLFSGNRE